MEILGEATPMLEKVSVDEAYLDLSPKYSEHASDDDALFAAVPVAKMLKERIRKERNLTATIGIAANKFLAKLGSDFQKPNGLTLIPERDKALFLRPLAVGSIPGVGPVTARTLNEHGFSTIGDLQDTKRDLRALLGSFAETIRQRAFGEDSRVVDLSDERKSISSENTFLHDTDDRPTLRAALKELAVDVAHTLEREAVGALTVQVKVRYGDFTTLTRQFRVDEPVTTADEIYRLSCHLLARHKLVKSPLRLIGIGVSTLVPPTVQLHLPL
jgi:DNA polymerase-4